MRLARRTVAALAVALLLAGSAAAAAKTSKPVAPAKTYPTGTFTVAGRTISPHDVLDARALPDMEGKPSLMITLAPAAATAVTGAVPQSSLSCQLDGKPLGDSGRDLLAGEHVLQISGDFGDFDATAALARRISGRDPLPDAEGDE